MSIHLLPLPPFSSEIRLTGGTKNAIASLEPVVQNKQDSPEDSGHCELARKRSPLLRQLSRISRTVLKTAVTEVGSGCPCGRESLELCEWL